LDSDKNGFTVISRLFTIINDLSHEKQFSLYKQLAQDNIETELFKLIIEMSEDEKTQLLMQLEAISEEDEPLQTLDLDADESFMREVPRKLCLIPVKCTIEGRSFKSHIIDISKLGAFIESKDLFPVDQKISMAFKLPDYPEAFQLEGRIARSGPGGIGVRFNDLAPDQEDAIRKFIDSKK
jgi:hypothetical protein